jgi:hypothetical protein
MKGFFVLTEVSLCLVEQEETTDFWMKSKQVRKNLLWGITLLTLAIAMVRELIELIQIIKR